MFDKFTIELSQADICKLITEKILTKHPYATIGSIDFHIVTNYDMRNEPYSHTLKSVKVSVDTERRANYA